MPGFVVDIVDLPRQAGSTKDVHLEVAAPEGLGTEVVGALPGSAVELDAVLTSLDDGVLASGRAVLDVHGQCVRCLTDFDERRTVTFDEMYLLPEAVERQLAEGDGEVEDLFVVGCTSLDLEPALRDALVLDLPFQPLCRPDCPGLCPDCGERLADLPADHHHELLDPRWSSLAGLLAQDEDGSQADRQVGTQADSEADSEDGQA